MSRDAERRPRGNGDGAEFLAGWHQSTPAFVDLAKVEADRRGRTIMALAESAPARLLLRVPDGSRPEYLELQEFTRRGTDVMVIAEPRTAALWDRTIREGVTSWVQPL